MPWRHFARNLNVQANQVDDILAKIFKIILSQNSLNN